MTTSSQQNIETYLSENNIPHDEQHLKNWSTQLHLINLWSKCESEIPYENAVHEPQARANFDLVSAKAHNLGVSEVKPYSFSDVYDHGMGMQLVRELFEAFVVQGKTVSPLKRQSYEERRARYGNALDWKKELQLQFSSDDEGAMEDRNDGNSNKEIEQPNKQGRSQFAKLASITGVLALAAVMGVVALKA